MAIICAQKDKHVYHKFIVHVHVFLKIKFGNNISPVIISLLIYIQIAKTLTQQNRGYMMLICFKTSIDM